MSKIALMTLSNREDSALSDHFGKAKWILIRDMDSGDSHFVENQSLSGNDVLQHLVREGCKDVLLREIGIGAFGHMKEADIRAWLAPENVPVSEILKKFAEGSLTQVLAPTEHAGSCGCTQRVQEKQCCGSCK
jgi:predicted Fe-Mo cluster-binding NifX family protein